MARSHGYGTILLLSFPRKRESIRGAAWHCVMDSRVRVNDKVSFQVLPVLPRLASAR